MNPENRQARDYLRDMEERLLAADPPPTADHDWAWRAQRTLSDLVDSPKATRLEYGDRYVMPYVAGQYPDSLVQLALVTALGTYGRSKGARLPFERTLRAGVQRFYDPNVRTLRRYLPSVGEEKDYDAVDSWYLYHPMLSLALQARHGDRDALDLLLRSVDYGIRAAHHFGYAWPVFYNIRDFSVIMQQPDGLRPGETDAGGIYAYLMLALHELTGEARFIDEASNALVAADGRGLDLMYQANLTAWGAAASLKLWQHSKDEGFRDSGYYWLANLLRHCVLTEIENGCAAHYPTFMGVPCMYNSAYMAPFEDMECFLALGEFLKIGGNELDRSAVTLVQAFRTHARHRGWYYYPEMLPPEIIATEQESGEIDRELSFPLEDLYPNGDAPGQIGQEIYGSGIALIYAAGS